MKMVKNFVFFSDKENIAYFYFYTLQIQNKIFLKQIKKNKKNKKIEDTINRKIWGKKFIIYYILYIYHVCLYFLYFVVLFLVFLCVNILLIKLCKHKVMKMSDHFLQTFIIFFFPLHRFMHFVLYYHPFIITIITF